MNEYNVCIFKLEKTLDEILPLLKNVYFKPINELDYIEGDKGNKSCIYKWKGINENGFKKNTIKVSSIDFTYIEAAASVEVVTMTKAKRELIGSKVRLEKNMLVEEKFSFVYFVDYMGAVYSIISGPKELEGRIRSTLMEKSIGKDSKWGTIYFNNISQYHFLSNFYYWIINKKGTDMVDGGNSIKVIDLKGFKSDTERDASSFSGEGTNIDRRIPLKSIISMGDPLVNLYVYMSYNNIIYSFVLHNDGRVTVYLSECGEIGVSEPKMLEFKEVILTIYFLIIPMLNKKFNEIQINDWDEHEKRIRKIYAIDVILELMKFNDLDIVELKTAVDSAS